LAVLIINSYPMSPVAKDFKKIWNMNTKIH